jgi:hypothetical protein
VRALCLLLLAPVAFAQTAIEGRPRHNTTYVGEDDEVVRALVARSTEAANAKDYATAAAKLQELILAGRPSVVPVRGRELYVSPRRWAQIQLLAEAEPFPREVLVEWRRMHEPDAAAAIRGALALGDEAALLHALDRYPASSIAPAALLALADRALYRGDADAAAGFLERVPEHVARSEEALLAGAAYAERRARVAASAAPPPAGWPTLGGDVSRARRGDPIPPPGELALRWTAVLLESAPSILRVEFGAYPRVRSAELPFLPIVDPQRVYVHLGVAVAIYDRATGKLLRYAGAREVDALAVDEVCAESPGARSATVSGGTLYFDQAQPPRGGGRGRSSRLVAFGVEADSIRWTAPGPANAHDPLFERAPHFRGAPAVAYGCVFVCAAVREREAGQPTRKEEAYVLCFRASDGALLWKRFLGYGDGAAPPAFPPLSGLPPAVARGVVVAVTGLGVAAALDARTGEALWLARYSRVRPEERERLSAFEERSFPLRSSWLHEAPRIAGDSVYFAPFDSEELHAYWLRGARDPATGAFHAAQWEKHRTRHHRNCQLETVGGIVGPRIVLVGIPDERSLPVYEHVVSIRLADGLGAAYGRLPATDRAYDGRARPPQLFGRPAVAGDVLLVPTARRIYRFRAGEVREDVVDGEIARDLEPLGSYDAEAFPGAEALDDTGSPAPVFGSLVAVDGQLFAVTGDRVLCFGERRP